MCLINQSKPYQFTTRFQHKDNPARFVNQLDRKSILNVERTTYRLLVNLPFCRSFITRAPLLLTRSRLKLGIWKRSMCLNSLLLPLSMYSLLNNLTLLNFILLQPSKGILIFDNLLSHPFFNFPPYPRHPRYHYPQT